MQGWIKYVKIKVQYEIRRRGKNGRIKIKCSAWNWKNKSTAKETIRSVNHKIKRRKQTTRETITKQSLLK